MCNGQRSKFNAVNGETSRKMAWPAVAAETVESWGTHSRLYLASWPPFIFFLPKSRTTLIKITILLRLCPTAAEIHSSWARMFDRQAHSIISAPFRGNWRVYYINMGVAYCISPHIIKHSPGLRMRKTLHPWNHFMVTNYWSHWRNFIYSRLNFYPNLEVCRFTNVVPSCPPELYWSSLNAP